MILAPYTIRRDILSNALALRHACTPAEAEGVLIRACGRLFRREPGMGMLLTDLSINHCQQVMGLIRRGMFDDLMRKRLTADAAIERILNRRFPTQTPKVLPA